MYSFGKCIRYDKMKNRTYLYKTRERWRKQKRCTIIAIRTVVNHQHRVTGGRLINKVRFEYLGWVVRENVKNCDGRGQSNQKWRKVTRVLCDKMVPLSEVHTGFLFLRGMGGRDKNNLL